MVLKRVLTARQFLPRDVYFWLKALLLSLVAIQVARLAWALLTPLGPVGQWMPAIPQSLPEAAQIALFSSLDPFAGAVPAAAAAQAGPAITGFTLFGTRAAASGVAGSAIIAGPDGVQESYAVGDQVAPGIRLASVSFDFVMLDNGSQPQKLAMPGSEPAEGEGAGSASQAGAAPAAVASSQPSQVALTPQSIRQNIAFAPRNSGGRVTGLLVSPVGADATLRAAGLQSGDVIVAVNGRRIASAADAASLQSQLTPGARLSLEVERGAGTVPVAILLPGTR